MWPFNRKKWEKLGVPFTADQASNILNNWLRPHREPDLADRAYRAIPFSDYQWLLMERQIDPTYTAEIWDCDNFTDAALVDVNRAWAEKSRGKEALLHGYIKGLIKNPDGTNVCHAWVWHIDDKGIGRFIEPQGNIERFGVEYTYALRA